MHSIGVLVQHLRVNLPERDWCLDLSELTSIQLGEHAFQFQDKDKTSDLIMRSDDDERKWWIDLPKLTSLTTEGEGSESFSCVRNITLESDSSLSSLTNRHALSHHCVSSQGLWESAFSILQQLNWWARVMTRHWRMGPSSKHYSLQPRCQHTYCWWFHDNRSKRRSIDCGYVSM